MEEIEQNVKAWAANYLPNFTFRPYQLEYIVKTIDSILNHTRVNLIEAPTGSGKSIMVIIMAGTLDKYYNMTSFILCSDLYLWQQYADAIDRYNLYFGRLKGTVGNYICPETGVDVFKCPCKLAQVSAEQLYNAEWAWQNGWSCALQCEYIKERHKAITSPVTLLTYQLYFPHMNVEDIKDKVFKERDIVFCDECHNVPNLCQEFGTLTIDVKADADKLESLLDFCVKNPKIRTIMEIDEDKKDQSMQELREIYQKILDTDYHEQKTLLKLLYDYMMWLKNYPQLALETFAYIYKDIFDHDKKYNKNLSKKKLTVKEYRAIDIAKWADAIKGHIEDTYTEYAEVGDNWKYIVKTDNMTPDPNDPRKMIWPENPQVGYKYAQEDVWVYDFILKHQKSTVLLSATIGDHDAFDENIGTKYFEDGKSHMDVIPSTFDFSKSPIYYIPGNKMSKAYIDNSLIENAKIINRILKSPKHCNEKGIIHTGSYKNAYKLLELLDEDVKKRIFIYNNSKEKQDTLSEYENSKNGILVGPTLTEGIDLPDDGCRFIIILKIPYPNIGDNFVKAKMALYPRWYNSQTSNNVIQGIGRGNRTPSDWCTTYILDGCFANLYQDTRLQYPKEMRDRIQIISK